MSANSERDAAFKEFCARHCSPGADGAKWYQYIWERAWQAALSSPHTPPAVEGWTSREPDRICFGENYYLWATVQLTQRQAFEGGKMIGKILGARVTDEMVSRFLCWQLPDNFSPDCGITFKRTHSETGPFGPQKREPTGTNLLDAAQARAMLEHVIGTAVEPVALTDAQLDKIAEKFAFFTDIEDDGRYRSKYEFKTKADIRECMRAVLAAAQEVEFTDDPFPTYKPDPPLEWEQS